MVFLSLSLRWSTLPLAVEAEAVLGAFSGKEGQGRCEHHPILSLTTLQCTLPSEWATHACISFTTHPEHCIHLHFHPLKCKVKVDL